MKIAKISFFNENTKNIGGILQAYALNRVLTDMGHDVTELNFCPILQENVRYGLFDMPKRIFNKFIRMKDSFLYNKYIKLHSEDFAKRYEAIDSFKKRLDFTSKCDEQSIKKYADCFDAYICGSDQIWNTPKPEFFLQFANPDKIRFSYAASFANNDILKSNKTEYTRLAKGLNAVSLREKSNCEVFEAVTNVTPTDVLDPTLLLNQTEWDDVCDEKLFDNYVFCYFLGKDHKMRRRAKQYANENKKQLVSMPFVNGYAKEDEELYGAFGGPSEFLSLIKYADAVFTDSFHASVFSLIYHKSLFVFGRVCNGFSMNVRLKDLFDTVGASSDFDGTSEISVDFQKSDELINIQKDRSLRFIRETLKNANKL